MAVELTDAMISAAKENNVDKLETFEPGNLRNARDGKNQSLLFYAIRQNAYEAFAYLLAIDLDPAIENNFEETPLHIAAYLGNASIVEHLIERGAKIDVKNRKLQTPIMLAAQKGNLPTVKMLINAGSVLTDVDQDGDHVLMYAVKSKKLKVVNALIDAGAPIHWLNRKQESVMHVCASNGLHTIFDRLFDLGVNPFQRNIYHQTALHYAVNETLEDILDRLLEIGLNSYDKDHFGESPYDRAEHRGYDIAILKFTRVKTDPETYNYKQRYPLHHALRFNRFDQAFALMHTEDVNEKDRFGNTPLFYALMLRDHVLVDALIQRKASITDIDAFGNDIYFYPTLDKNIPLLRRILQYMTENNISQKTQDLVRELADDKLNKVYDITQ